MPVEHVNVRAEFIMPHNVEVRNFRRNGYFFDNLSKKVERRFTIIKAIYRMQISWKGWSNSPSMKPELIIFTWGILIQICDKVNIDSISWEYKREIWIFNK